MVLAAGISVAGALLFSKGLARLLSYKFVDQVNRMTGAAKAIANSRDLSKRIETFSRPDELKNLESALNEMLDQLEDAFETQKRFTADASHELRTPLAVLNGYLDILEEWGKNDPALLEESLKAMKEEIRHLEKLSESLLLLSRLESGQHNLELETIELNQLLDKLVKDTTLIAGDRRIGACVNGIAKIKGDYSLLLQMLRAVIENSIKYTAADGRITVKFFPELDRTVIEISDNGIGIPEQDLEKIFERFYRVDKSRDRAKGGAGLGLSLAKHIAELHGGAVEAESRIGKGTTIRFRLPLNPV